MTAGERVARRLLILDEALSRLSQRPIKSELHPVGVRDSPIIIGVSLGKSLHGCHRLLWPDKKHYLISGGFRLTQGNQIFVGRFKG